MKTVPRYVLAWFGLMALAILNGTVRDFVYTQSLGDLAAHQVSTVSLLVLFSFTLWFLLKKWPLASGREAWTIGIIWLVMTELFEFGMGLSRGAPWSELWYAYDLTEGQVWIFIPVWTLFAPYLSYRFRNRRFTGPGEGTPPER